MLYPVHLNPNVREPVNRLLADVGNIYLIKPLSYLPFVYLMSRAYVILTNSGGAFRKKPRGTMKLVGSTEVSSITEELARLLTDERAYREMGVAHNPYGDRKRVGKLSRRMLILPLQMARRHPRLEP